jgi:hypothetical protein
MMKNNTKLASRHPYFQSLLSARFNLVLGLIVPLLMLAPFVNAIAQTNVDNAANTVQSAPANAASPTLKAQVSKRTSQSVKLDAKERLSRFALAPRVRSATTIGTNAAVARCGDTNALPGEFSCTVTGNLVCDQLLSETQAGCSFEGGSAETYCEIGNVIRSVSCSVNSTSSEATANCYAVTAANGVSGAVDSICEFDTIANVTVLPATLAFGNVAATVTVEQPLTISNIGNFQVMLTGGSATTADFATGTNLCGSILLAGESCVHNVKFLPPSVGQKADTYVVKVASSTGLPSNKNIAVNGTRFAAGNAIIASETQRLDFTPSLQDGAQRGLPLVYRNSGDGTFAGNVEISGNFVVRSSSCGGTLDAAQRCTVEIAPAAQFGGILRGSARIKGLDGRVWAVIPLAALARVVEDCE